MTSELEGCHDILARSLYNTDEQGLASRTICGHEEYRSWANNQRLKLLFLEHRNSHHSSLTFLHLKDWPHLNDVSMHSSERLMGNLRHSDNSPKDIAWASQYVLFD